MSTEQKTTEFNPVVFLEQSATYAPIKHLVGRKITAELAFDLFKAYNEREWRKKIDRISAMEEVQFYFIPADKVFSYDRLYATYRTSDSVKILTQICYSSMLTDRGFAFIRISENTSGEVTFERGVIGENGRMQNQNYTRSMLSQTDFIVSNEF